MIKAVIFDMDGVLIDSEPSWRQTMTEVFARAGIPYSEQEAAKSQGVRIGDIVRQVSSRHPMADWTAEKLDKAVCDRVSELVLAHGRVMPGIGRILDFVGRKGIKLGLATSTPREVAVDFIRRIGIGNDLDAVCTGDEVGYGKPHPEIYLLCASRLGVLPEECLVFEDSISGVTAAKAARCRCIAVPEPAMFDDPRYGIADLKLHSLEEFEDKMAL